MPIELSPVEPREAVAYFQKKGLAQSFAWQDLWQEDHAKAFTVAKAMNASLLQDIRDAVDGAIADGTTVETFKGALTPLLQARGWWGKQQMVDPLTGEEKTVQLGSPRRLETIFDVNMRTAYQAGRWQRVDESKAAVPYLQYSTAGDDRVRPEHAAWDGTILPVGDPWWDTHYPPCDWECRCTADPVSDGQMDRNGWSVTDSPVKFPDQSYTNPRTGETVSVEKGIGPGWAYNVGKAYLDRDAPSPMGPARGEGSDEASAAAAGVVKRRRAIDAGNLLPPDVDRAEAAAAFLGGFDLGPTEAKVYLDRSGDGLIIGPALFKTAAARPARLPRRLLRILPMVGLTLREPDLIKRIWRFGPGGLSLLIRRYAASFSIEDRPIDVVVDWSAGGWWAASSMDRGFDFAAAIGPGATAWPRRT